MVSIRLSSFVFMLMFTLLEARDSTYYKHNYQGILDTKVAPKSKDVIVRGTPAIVDEETTPHVLETKEEGNDMRLKGRRLATKARISRKSKANEGAGKTRSSEMSGRMTTASRIPKSQATPKDENHSMGKTEKMTSVNNAKQHGSEHRGTHDDPFQKLDSHDLEAANEVWTFMNKDYPGNGRARHNPPINNR